MRWVMRTITGLTNYIAALHGWCTASPMRLGPLSNRRSTAASFLARAHAWHTSAGITIERSGALEGSAGSSAEAVNVAPWLSVSIWVQRDWNEALRSSGPCNKRHAS